jgi:hypothetical protein
LKKAERESIIFATVLGGVAQLGERTVRIRKVESSILFVSTNPGIGQLPAFSQAALPLGADSMPTENTILDWALRWCFVMPESRHLNKHMSLFYFSIRYSTQFGFFRAPTSREAASGKL